MIGDLAAHVPASLSAYRDGVAVGPGGPGAMPLVALRDPARFDAMLAAFGAGLGADPEAIDRRALVSYWSQFYLAALATPALTAILCVGRPLPLAFDTVSLELDAGRPTRFLVAPEALTDATGRDPARGAGLAGLMEGHLRPFVKLCHAHCGLAPRVVWGNAAVILEYVARELGGGETPACAEVGACLGWGGAACTLNPLAQALCAGASGCRRRRVCCLRQRLPGICSCGTLCPLAEAPLSRPDA